MFSSIYTFKNKQVILFTKPKYYLINNHKQFQKLLDEFMDIDAVSTPIDITFPCILKLENGFAPRFTKSNKKEYIKDYKQYIKTVKKQSKKILKG